jgi:hypothetical protein
LTFTEGNSVEGDFQKRSRDGGCEQFLDPRTRIFWGGVLLENLS